jgi:hypothetical protein
MLQISRRYFPCDFNAARPCTQAPGPVPALPDTERRTSYTLALSTCGLLGSASRSTYAVGLNANAHEIAPVPTSAPRLSVVVLPFANLGGDPEVMGVSYARAA